MNTITACFDLAGAEGIWAQLACGCQVLSVRGNNARLQKRQILYESFTNLTGLRANVLENCLVDLQVSSVMATC